MRTTFAFEGEDAVQVNLEEARSHARHGGANRQAPSRVGCILAALHAARDLGEIEQDRERLAKARPLDKRVLEAV